jgi:hypothetical protein
MTTHDPKIQKFSARFPLYIDLKKKIQEKR